MKYYSSILTVLLSCLCFTAGAQSIQWEQNFGGTDNEGATHVYPTDDGGTIVAGNTSSSDMDVSNNYGEIDCWLLKLDSTGALEWEQNYGGSDNDFVSTVLQRPDGGFLMCGYTDSDDDDVSDNNGDSDFWVVKLDEQGNIIWEDNYGGTGIDRAQHINLTPDGNYIAVGFSYSDDIDVSGNNGGNDFWMIKLDTAGNLLWEQNYGGSDFNFPEMVQPAHDGGYIIAGDARAADNDVDNNYGNNDYWVVKTDSVGNLEWEQNYGGAGRDRAYAIVPTNDGNYVVAGRADSASNDISSINGSWDAWIIKIDQNGTLLWEQNYGGSDNDQAQFIQQTQNGELIATGFSISDDGDVAGNYGAADCWVLKLDTLGNLLWQQNFGSAGTNQSSTITQVQDGGYVFIGTADTASNDVSDNNGEGDIWVVKLTPDDVTDIHTPEKPSIAASISPNPTSGNITLQYTLNQSASVRLSVYSLQGKLMLNHNIGREAAGVYTLPLNLHTFEAGVYFYALEINGQRQTGKLIVTRN